MFSCTNVMLDIDSCFTYMWYTRSFGSWPRWIFRWFVVVTLTHILLYIYIYVCVYLMLNLVAIVAIETGT